MERKDKISISSKKNVEYSQYQNSLEFAKLVKNYLRPPSSPRNYSTTYTRYSKSDILGLLNQPAYNEKPLRDASIYLYNMSSHYRRLISYFSKMPTYNYYLSPIKMDTETKKNTKSYKNCFKKAVDQVELMNIKHEVSKIATVCFREDVFYGYEYETKDSYYIKKLNPDYCRIVSVEDGCYTFEFNFGFFDSRSEMLPYYGSEFEQKYELYRQNPAEKRWQELNTKHEVCFKINEDLDYAIPPFAGTFPDIYDISDYKQLLKAKTEVENYKLVYLKIPYENGAFKLPLPLANSFYDQLAGQLPEGIGLGMSPMELDSVKFENSGSTQDTDAVARSEAAFWSASGASSAILGKDDITSSSALMLSIETDAGIIYTFLRQVERWINRKLKQLSGTYHFKLTFLDQHIFNRKEVQDQMLKACQYSFPMKYAAAAAFGLSPSDFNGTVVLENDMMQLHEHMIPVSSSYTQPSNEENVGRPAQTTVDEAGEMTEERDANDR